MLAVILAVAVAAAGSNLVNQGLEADIDAVMRRTRGRAVASRQVSALAVIAVGLILVASAVVALAVAANLLAGLLTLAAAVTLRARLHRSPETAILEQHRDRRCGRGLSAADRRSGRLRARLMPWACTCSPLCFSGRRRTSGRSRCYYARTMPPRKSQCLEPSPASVTLRFRSSCTSCCWLP